MGLTAGKNEDALRYVEQEYFLGLQVPREYLQLEHLDTTHANTAPLAVQVGCTIPEEIGALQSEEP